MTHTFLLEIGLEEMPSRFILSSVEQLKKRMETFLKEKEMSYQKIEVYSTPRRLALSVTGLPNKQEDKKETAKGPSKKAGMDENGEWTKAALGFARGKKVSEDSLYLEEVKGIDYIFANVETKGRKTEKILPEVSALIESMDFPISMRWADHSFKYLRPVHWIVALLDDQLIPFTALGIKSGRKTRGHRFLGKERDVSNASSYKALLKEEFVLVDREERKQLIADQLKVLEKQEGWSIPDNPSLLNEVTDMVEFPTAFSGSFSSEYLTVPDQALVTTMRDHQRYFDVRDENGKILPYFVSVRNGNDEHIETVKKGNEKVLRARLADAAFFFQEDLNESIESELEKLKRVTFYEGMGTLYEKSARVKRIASFLGKLFSLPEETIQSVERAALIGKFDLVSNMVDEFPELQGVMAEIYAVIKKESPVVAQSIREQYLPLTSNGPLPESVEGSLLSVSEKMDTLIQFFHAGILPTGSADPFALRRQAYGVIRILRSNEWTFSVKNLLTELSRLTVEEDSQNMHKLSEFLLTRLKKQLSEDGYRYDVIEAILASNQDEVLLLRDTAKVLQAHLNDHDFKPVIESLTRVSRLAQKAEKNASLQKINPEIFESNSEKSLYTSLKGVSERINAPSNEVDREEMYGILRGLHEPIDQFFEDNMVMADDEAVRKNRLMMLKVIDSFVLHFADVEKLVIK